MVSPDYCPDFQSILHAKREAKLLEFLCESFPDRSKKSIKSLLEQKQIMIRDQIVTRFDYPLAPGMDVIIPAEAGIQYFLNMGNRVLPQILYSPLLSCALRVKEG